MSFSAIFSNFDKVIESLVIFQIKTTWNMLKIVLKRNMYLIFLFTIEEHRNTSQYLLIFPQLIHFDEGGESVMLWHKLQPISVLFSRACCHDNAVCCKDLCQEGERQGQWGVIATVKL